MYRKVEKYLIHLKYEIRKQRLRNVGIIME